MYSVKRALPFICVVLLLAAAAGSWGFSQVPREPDETPGKVLVRFQDGVDEARIAEIVDSVGGKVKDVLKSTGVYIIVLPEGADAGDAAKRYSSYEEVEYAEPSVRATPLEGK